MTSIILYGLSIFLLVLSFIKDKPKTKKALISALKSFENIMPQFLFIVVTVGILLAFLRNFIGFIFSIIVGLLLGRIMMII